ncbi:MAG TPA: hypothetical protein VFG71_00090 [Nitrospiraceae bacterium]|nr:hypothetical protein [Nitrospiraceae bacterium]
MPSGRAWIVGGLALAISYAIASLTPLNQWIGFWLRGSFYTAYQVLFLGALWVWGALLAARYHKRSRSLAAMAMWGILFGYLAGLFALLFHPLLQQDGVHLFMESLRISTPEGAVAILWFPIRLLSWLYGAMLGLLIPLVVRIINRL